MDDSDRRLSELVADAISSKMQHHRQEEQQQVDGLLASQKFLTSNLRTLINSLETILQLSTPRYNSSQGDLVTSCAHRARALGQRLEQVAARLARIQDHLDNEEVKLGLRLAAASGDDADDAAGAAAATSADTPGAAPLKGQQQQQQPQQQQQQEREQQQTGQQAHPVP